MYCTFEKKSPHLQAKHPLNSKQTQESLESGFPETIFRETNIALAKLWIIKSIYQIKFNNYN
jgi:hypothetical protein